MIIQSTVSLIHQSPKAKIEWFEEGSFVRKTFNGFIMGEEMQNAFMAGLEVLKQYEGQKWLSDNRYVKLYRPEDAEWINQVWFVEAKKAGWQYWAVLEPEDIFGQQSLRPFIVAFAQQGITLKVFHQMEEAIEWLRQID